MSHQKIDYEERIRAAGYRVTMQRLLILDAVCQGAGHSTIHEIIAHVKDVDPSIDKSTVYRVLEMLRDVRLITGADTDEGTVYEIASETPHHHLICEQCGAVQEVDHAVVGPLIEQVQQRYSFNIRSNHLILYGLCAECAAATGD
jgi:Fur family ferric uptake transcriptional regulator